MSNRFKLISEIIARSNASTWDEAKLEWELREIYKQTEPGTCLCGKHPIHEMCVLRNAKNGNGATVGNVCVTKFMGLRSDKIFAAVKRIYSDIDKALNAEAIDHAHSRGWFNNRDRTFYMDTWRKRDLSTKQLQWRRSLNRRVLAKVRSD